MNRVTASLLATITAAGVLAGAAATASAAQSSAKAKTIQIVMKDPGCHWFLVGGKYKTKFVAKGKTTFENLDEATLLFKGASYSERVPVGKTVTVAKPGTYHITMVNQAKDDNHLVLVVK